MQHSTWSADFPGKNLVFEGIVIPDAPIRKASSSPTLQLSGRRIAVACGGFFLRLIIGRFIDSDAVNDPNSTANTAVPAEFAGFFTAERFIGNLGHNSAFRKTAQERLP
jgi:hypothetical protein